MNDANWADDLLGRQDLRKVDPLVFGELMDEVKKSVLLADADESLLRSLAEILGSRGLRVILASTAERARELLLTEKPSLLLITQKFPDGSGMDIVEERRRSGDMVPVIFTTAPFSDQLTPIGPRLVAAGITETVEKPVDPLKLAEKVQQLVGLPGPALTPGRGIPEAALAMTLGYSEGRQPKNQTRPLAELVGSVPLPELSDPNDPLIGTTVGSFRILKRVGRGGMGVVYLAQHPMIGSRVAIKFIHESAAAHPEAVRRFFAEAKVTNMVGHESIVNIIDLNEVRGRFYIVMEYLDGDTLGARLKQGPLPVDETVRILTDLCAALQAAHAQGVIHRDLKPDNIFLIPRKDRPALVKIVDFGIAKLREEHVGGITQTGDLMGTPRYMSPEQCDGKIVDGRSDQYALGLIAYEMLVGHAAVEGSSMSDIIKGHTERVPPSPHALRSEVNEHVSHVIMRMLGKRPEQRYEDMAAAARALLDALDGRGPLAETPLDRPVPNDHDDGDDVLARGSRNRMLFLGGAISVALTAVIGLFAFSGNAPVEAPVNAAPVAKKEPVVEEKKPVVVEEVKATPPPAAEEPKPAPQQPPKKVEKTEAASAHKEKPAGKTGLVSLQSTPWAKIVVDGKDTGKFTPVADLELPVGSHEVTLVNDKVMKRAQFRINVRANKKVTESRTLE